MRMNPLDAVWLMMESSDTPMHVGVLAVFSQPQGAAPDYLQHWAEQMRSHTALVAPWNNQLADARIGSVIPRLVEEVDVDLGYHFRHTALPQPGGERELGVVVSRLHSHALDRHRPLWEFHLIEGLERDRFALYIKVHKALIANVNGIPLMMSWLSRQADKRNLPPFWTMPLETVADDEQPDTAGWGGGPSPGDLLEVVSTIGQAAAGVMQTALQRDHEGSVLKPFGTPRSTLNRHINAQRRFATQQFPQARIQALADASGSTLNEILAYLCSSSLRRFFKEYNALPEKSLIAALPVSLAEHSERLPGNAIAGLRVALATHIGDPLARLTAIQHAMAEVREDRASLPQAAVTSYVMLRAAPTYASQLPVMGQFVPPLFNLSVSNTPGPEKPLYLDGAPLEALYPISPLLQYSALSIDCVSYTGTLNIGFTGARDTLPHLQRLAVYLGKAVDELEQLLQNTRVSA